jgi:hypothetical protein
MSYSHSADYMYDSAMNRFVHLRRFVLSISLVGLVWCQTCAVALGCMVSSPASTASTAAVAPCEQSADHQDGSNRSDCKTRCPSRDASLETAKIYFSALADLPLQQVLIALLAPVAAIAVPMGETAERAAPPPLIMVYGRLLI